MIEDDFLSKKINDAELFIYPFPHMVINNFFEKEIYEEIEKLFEDNEIRKLIEPSSLSNKLSLASLFDQDIKLRVDEILDLNSRRQLFSLGTNTFLSSVLKKFRPVIGEIQHALSNSCLTKNRNSTEISDSLSFLHRSEITNLHSYEKSDETLYYEVQLGVNSPAYGLPSKVRGVHVDHPAKLFNALIYFRQKEDNYSGGDFCLYRFKDSRAHLYYVNALEQDCTLAKVVPYKANSFVIFLNSNNSLHSVIERHNTPIERRYINISGRFRFDYMNLNTAQASKFRIPYLYERFFN
jgi:hypothetical protein